MEFITANAAEPFLLTESGAVYMVQSGRVEVYVVRLENGVSAGRRRNLFTAEPGQALFGLPPSGQTGLLACGADGAELLKRESSILLDTAYRRQDTLFAEPVLFMAESWILTLWAALVRQALPTRFKALAAGNSLTVSAGTIANSRTRREQPIRSMVSMRRIFFSIISSLSRVSEAKNAGVGNVPPPRRWSADVSYLTRPISL